MVTAVVVTGHSHETKPQCKAQRGPRELPRPREADPARSALQELDAATQMNHVG